MYNSWVCLKRFNCFFRLRWLSLDSHFFPLLRQRSRKLFQLLVAGRKVALTPIYLLLRFPRGTLFWSRAVRPEKNRQMSIKVAKNDLTGKRIDLQKLPKYVGDLGKINCCQKKLAQSPINCPIWSHCSPIKFIFAFVTWTYNIIQTNLLTYYGVAYSNQIAKDPKYLAYRHSPFSSSYLCDNSHTFRIVLLLAR